MWGVEYSWFSWGCEREGQRGWWRVENLSTGTDSTRCNGLLRMQQGYTTLATPRTVLHWRSEKHVTPGQPGCRRHLGTVGGRFPSAASVLVGENWAIRGKFMCWCVLRRFSSKSLFLSLSAPRGWTQSVTNSTDVKVKVTLEQATKAQRRVEV